MVIKGKEGLSKNKFLPIFFILIIAGFFLFVLAYDNAAILESPTNYTNLSTIMNFSCLNVTVSAAVNATLYYNASGGAATVLFQDLNVGNLSGLYFENASAYVGNLPQSSLYNFTCIIANNTEHNASFSVHNVTIDYTPPAVVFESTAAVTHNGGYNGIIVINASVNDTIGTDPLMGVESVFFNITYASNATQLNFTQASNDSNNYWNITLDTSGFPEAEYNITVFANDSQRYDASTKENHTEFIHIYVDRSPPSAIVLTKSNSTKTTLGIDIAITDALSGIDSTCTVEPRSGTTLSGTTTSQTLAVNSLTCGATYTYTVTCGDKAGNYRSSTPYSFQTDSCTGAAGSPGGSSSTTAYTTKSAINEIFPGTPQTITSFDSSGIPEMTIEVNSQANDVKITVTEYQSKPSEIAVSNENSYNYFKFETQNLVDKLSKAIIKVKVLKSWVTAREITKEDVSLFRYDETSNVWGELTTTYDSESDNYYYYTIELDSFSYFSIAPKEGVVVGGEEEEGEQPEAETNLTWLWIIIAIIVIAIIVGGGVALKKRKR